MLRYGISSVLTVIVLEKDYCEYTAREFRKRLENEFISGERRAWLIWLKIYRSSTMTHERQKKSVSPLTTLTAERRFKVM